MTAAHKPRIKVLVLSRLPLSSLLLLSFRSSSVGLETGEWRRFCSLSLTPPASLRFHSSRPEGVVTYTHRPRTELLVVSANLSLHHNFTFQLGSSTLTPSKTAKHLGVVIDDKLNFSDYIVQIAQSYRFVLYNMKIRPFLSEHATQLLVQALVRSRLDYCNALLAGLPNNSIKPLQLGSCGSVVRALC